MSDIDGKIAAFIGWNYSDMLATALWDRPRGSDAKEATEKFHRRLHARLLSDSGMRAMMEALGLELEVTYSTIHTTTFIKARQYIGNANYADVLNVHAPDLPTAVYEAVKAYVEMK